MKSFLKRQRCIRIHGYAASRPVALVEAAGPPKIEQQTKTTFLFKFLSINTYVTRSALFAVPHVPEGDDMLLRQAVERVHHCYVVPEVHFPRLVLTEVAKRLCVRRNGLASHFITRDCLRLIRPLQNPFLWAGATAMGLYTNVAAPNLPQTPQKKTPT